MRCCRGLTIIVLLAAGNCGQKQATGPATRTNEAPVPAAGIKQEAPSIGRSVLSANIAGPQLAYTYDVSLQLPAKAVVPLFERHRKDCELAGVDRCQIIGAETESVAGTDTSATLTLRAETRWLAAFRSRLAGDAAGADGRVVGSKTASEDLGRDISDTAAKLRALTTLQGRLEALLANRAGKLSDLLEIERELARVGGEIDATRSALADMSGRVTLPKMTILYQPNSLAVAGAGRGSRLGGDLYNVSATSLFVLLNLVAAVIPWLIVLVPLGWLARFLVTRHRRH